MPIIRHNVWNLAASDDTLLWYGRAIGAMQNRPITDPTSWRFQAAIHEYLIGEDPLAVPGEALPSSSIRRHFWTQCQHGSWFFLSWHRMYLHFFEQIVAAEVVTLGGPEDWALPYWDYSTDLQSRLLPEAFRDPLLPDGSKNFLHVDQRDPDCNAGQQFADDGDVALQAALIQANFSDPLLGNFGGLPSNSIHSGNGPGRLEGVPHGSMHNAVGGQGGWMGGFNTAGLDPIFWLHHANIDRLWAVWLDRDGSHHNPTSLQWLSMAPFSFHNATGQIVTMRCSEVTDTSALGYTYEDVSDPLGALPVMMAVANSMRAPMSNPIPPELVGATTTSFQIQNTPTHVSVPTPFHAAARTRLTNSVTAMGLTAAIPTGEAPEPRVLLQLENLTASGRANSYDVYVNIPDGEEPTQHPEQLAGRLDLFGVVEASRGTEQHAGSGLTYALDISNIYRSLSTQAGWDPANVRVSLVPVRKWDGAVVTVGRVSVFFG